MDGGGDVSSIKPPCANFPRRPSKAGMGSISPLKTTPEHLLRFVLSLWFLLARFTEILLILPLLNISVLSSGTKEQLGLPSLHPLPDGLDREGFRSLNVVVENRSAISWKKKLTKKKKHCGSKAMRKQIGGQCYVHVFSILVILMELWDLTLCLFCSTDAPSAGGMKEQSRTLPAQTFIEEDGERIA